MKNSITQENTLLNYAMPTLAWCAFLLMLLVLAMGESILQEVADIYPDWSFPAFFIPWFLLLISSVQKLRDKHHSIRLSVWMLKTTIPIFVFISPFVSQYFTANERLFGFEAYCLYVAIIVLFLLHFLPQLNQKS